jgi:anthranilate synthase component 1
VLRAKEYIAAGDMMQVQVGQRLRKRYTESPLSPVPRAAFAEPVAVHVLLRHGRLPDRRREPGDPVRQEHTPRASKVTIRPLAGTRPRGATPELDKALESELSPTRRSVPST